jgi:hypothetical protein
MPSPALTAPAVRTAPRSTGPPRPRPAPPGPGPPRAGRTADARDRHRRDRIDASGTVTLRARGRLPHLGTGRTHAGTRVLLLIHDLHVRVIHAATGELLRDLHIDPARDYQPTGRPRGPQKKTP